MDSIWTLIAKFGAAAWLSDNGSADKARRSGAPCNLRRGRKIHLNLGHGAPEKSKRIRVYSIKIKNLFFN
jgi:hypothetical protein